MKLYMLLAKCQIHGEVKEPGYRFYAADDWVGPMRTVVHTFETIDVGQDSKRTVTKAVDEPLYVVIDEPIPDEAREAEDGQPRDPTAGDPTLQPGQVRPERGIWVGPPLEPVGTSQPAHDGPSELEEHHEEEKHDYNG